MLRTHLELAPCYNSQEDLAAILPIEEAKKKGRDGTMYGIYLYYLSFRSASSTWESCLRIDSKIFISMAFFISSSSW